MYSHAYVITYAHACSFTPMWHLCARSNKSNQSSAYRSTVFLCAGTSKCSKLPSHACWCKYVYRNVHAWMKEMMILFVRWVAMQIALPVGMLVLWVNARHACAFVAISLCLYAHMYHHADTPCKTLPWCSGMNAFMICACAWSCVRAWSLLHKIQEASKQGLILCLYDLRWKYAWNAPMFW